MRIIDKWPSVVQKIIEHNPLYSRPDYGWVLMFHEISDDIDKDKEDITLSTKSFWNMIDVLSENFVFCSIGEILRNKGSHQIFITFDDVCMSAFNNAMKELEKREIPFCCFVSPSLVGKTGYVGKEQLQGLVDSPLCDIHPHGMNHIILRGKNELDIKKEISESKKWVDRIIGNKKENECLFAYPYGSIYAVSIAAVKSCKTQKFKYALGTVQLPLNKRFVSNNPFFLPRMNINEKNHANVMNRINEVS